MSLDSAGPSASVRDDGDEEEEDVWLTNLTSQGKPYYYNKKTRETTWTLPDGAVLARLHLRSWRDTKRLMAAGCMAIDAWRCVLYCLLVKVEEKNRNEFRNVTFSRRWLNSARDAVYVYNMSYSH